VAAKEQITELLQQMDKLKKQNRSLLEHQEEVLFYFKLILTDI